MDRLLSGVSLVTGAGPVRSALLQRLLHDRPGPRPQRLHRGPPAGEPAALASSRPFPYVASGAAEVKGEQVAGFHESGLADIPGMSFPGLEGGWRLWGKPHESPRVGLAAPCWGGEPGEGNFDVKSELIYSLP